MSTDLRPCPEHGLVHKYRTASGEQRCRQCQRDARNAWAEKHITPRQRAARRGREARAKIAATLAAFGLRPVRGGA